VAAKQRVAIIGTGNIARAHARAYQANAEVADVVAVADVDLERAQAFAQQHGFGDAYADAGQMLAAVKPDAVSICTPNYLHAPLSILALEAGVSVLCEKPMSTNLADAERMKATAERTGKTTDSSASLPKARNCWMAASMASCWCAGLPSAMAPMSNWAKCGSRIRSYRAAAR